MRGVCQIQACNGYHAGAQPTDDKGIIMPTSSKTQPRYKRVLLKLSGEALMGEHDFGIDPKVLDDLALEISDIVSLIANIIVGKCNALGIAASNLKNFPSSISIVGAWIIWGLVVKFLTTFSQTTISSAASFRFGKLTNG